MSKESKQEQLIREIRYALESAESSIHEAEYALSDLRRAPSDPNRVEQLESLIRAIGLDPDMTYTGGDLDAIREAVQWANPIGYKPTPKSAYKELLVRVEL